MIKEVCKRLGISQHELARRMRTEEKNAYRYFKRDYDPKFQTLSQIAKALRVKIRDLIKE